MNSQDDSDLKTTQEWEAQISCIRTGNRDTDGEVILLAFRVTNDFAVYITQNGVKHLSKLPIGGRFAQITQLVGQLNMFRNDYPFVDSSVAQAKCACLDGQPEVAVPLLERTLKRVKALKTNAARLRYLKVCMITAGVVVGIASIISHTRTPATHVLSTWIISCGAVGAFLSVALRQRALKIDPEASPEMTTFSAISRIAIGAIGAVFINHAVDGNLLLGFLGETNNLPARYALSIVAGFSESLVPNVMKNIENHDDRAAA